MAISSIPYPALESELDILQNRHLQRGMKGFRPIPLRKKSLEEVTEELIANTTNKHNLCKYAQERFDEASCGIHQLLWNFGRSWFWDPDIIFRAFNDLDVLFFNGVLYHRVYLRWIQNCPEGDIAETKGPLIFIRPRIRMTLFLDSIQGATLSELVGHLLHEMLHAYLMILTGGDDQEGGRRQYHGPCFRKCADAIARAFNGEVSVMDNDED